MSTQTYARSVARGMHMCCDVARARCGAMSPWRGGVERLLGRNPCWLSSVVHRFHCYRQALGLGPVAYELLLLSKVWRGMAARGSRRCGHRDTARGCASKALRMARDAWHGTVYFCGACNRHLHCERTKAVK